MDGGLKYEGWVFFQYLSNVLTATNLLLNREWLKNINKIKGRVRERYRYGQVEIDGKKKQ